MQHLEINLFTLTAEADRVFCQLVMFLILDVQNEIQLPSRVFCYSWLVCLFPYKNDHILLLVYCYLKTSFNYLKSSSSTKLAIFLLF